MRVSTGTEQPFGKRIKVSDTPIDIAYADGNVWVASFSGSGAMAVGDGAVWVASTETLGEHPVQQIDAKRMLAR